MWLQTGTKISRSVYIVHKATLSSSSMKIFDRNAKSIQKSRSCASPDKGVYDYLKAEVGYRLYDRICDVSRLFPVAVDLGCGSGHVSNHLLDDMVGHVIQYDLSLSELERNKALHQVSSDRIGADEEYIPFRQKSVDLVYSSLSLHWINDLPGTFKQVYNILVDDGCFMGVMFSGDTLFELRVSLQLAEMERDGGFAPHISPFTAAQDLGGLLNRAGYVMTTIDVDEFVIRYPSMFELMDDIKGMGENNCAWSRRPIIPRDTLMAAASIYRDMYEEDSEGVPATFQVLYFIGWKPHPDQPKSAVRGSAHISMKDLGNLDQVTKKLDTLKSIEGIDNYSASVDHINDQMENIRRKAYHHQQDEEDKKQ